MSVESFAHSPSFHSDPLLADLLLAHYDVHARALPWRLPPHSTERPDPYKVWLSEVMLQQTTVAAVASYYVKFLALWPTVQDLAAAQDADVMAAWAGLGYYARARNLLACARVVTEQHGGLFPETEAELLTLPGVGAYTAAAIAAIAFGRHAVVVDANVERVVARLFAIDTPLPAGRVEIRTATQAITPQQRAGDFAQAMMDLGAGICSVRAPACLLCPLASRCRGYQLGRADVYPVKPAKKEKPRRVGRVWWLERADGYVWLERRADKRMLGGMRGLPGSEWDKRYSDGGTPPAQGEWQSLNMPVEHVFTHFALTLTVARLVVDSDCIPAGQGEWWPIATVIAKDSSGAGLPTVYAKVARLVLKESL
jgi:A/G-specific adenine glycosylase